MKEESKRIRLMLENVFTETVNTLKQEHPSATVTDLYVQISQPKRMLSVYDDENRVLKNIYMEEELKDADKMDFFYTNAPRFVKEAAINCRNKKLFDDLNVLTPFSLVIVDDEGQTLSDYILLDSDKIVVEERLLKDLDKDLDLFLKNLLSDIE